MILSIRSTLPYLFRYPIDLPTRGADFPPPYAVADVAKKTMTVDQFKKVHELMNDAENTVTGKGSGVKLGKKSKKS